MRNVLCALGALTPAVVIFLLESPAFASTTITGGTIINQTWTPAGSPYVVQGDITIPSGSTLTIQAGTSVVFPSGDLQASGKDTTRTEVTVAGTLNVTGTSAQPVSFLAQTGTSSATWYGIVLEPTAQLTMSHADVEYSLYGIYSDGSPVSVTLSNSHFAHHYNAGTVRLKGTIVDCLFEDSGNYALDVVAPVSVDRVIIRSSGFALQVLPQPSQIATVSNVLVTGGSIGMVFDPSAQGTVNVTNVTIDGNSVGIDFVAVSAPQGLFNVTNTIVTNNKSIGVRWYSPQTNFQLTYSDVWGNATNFSGPSAGTGCISANPQFVDRAGGDYHLQSSSVCIDTGTATGAPTDDLGNGTRPLDGDGINGAQFDMGAYEYGAIPCTSCGADGGSPGDGGGSPGDGGSSTGDGGSSTGDGGGAVGDGGGSGEDGGWGPRGGGGCSCGTAPGGPAKGSLALIAFGAILLRARRRVTRRNPPV